VASGDPQRDQERSPEAETPATEPVTEPELESQPETPATEPVAQAEPEAPATEPSDETETENDVETDDEVEAPAERGRRVWPWVALLLIVAAGIGVFAGMTLGLRQDGPLGASSLAGSRPTIVIVTAVPSPSAAAASPVASVIPTPVTAVQRPAGTTEYVVQPGDTLRTIAQQQYGDPAQWPRIYQANRDVIGPDPDALQPGTRLMISN